MQRIGLTEVGRRHVVDYLNSAIERLADLEQREKINLEPDTVKLITRRTLGDLERVRLMLLIEFSPELPSNALKTNHDAPQQLPF